MKGKQSKPKRKSRNGKPKPCRAEGSGQAERGNGREKSLIDTAIEEKLGIAE